jgi:hypothetical protein
MAMSERSKGFRFRGLVLKMTKLLSLRFPFGDFKSLNCEIPSGPKLWHLPSDLWLSYRNTKNSWNSKFNINSF